MIRPLYNWTMSFAGNRNAKWGLVGVSFMESSFFPIPPDVLLVPMVLSNRDQAWYLAGICTIASVVGGVVGYAIGALLYDTVGLWVINLYGYAHQIEAFKNAYNEWGSWVILIKGVTPLPYKVATITSGFVGYDLFWFVFFSVIARSIRFFLVAGLLYYFGEPIREFIEKRLEWLTLAFAVILVGGFIALRYF